MSLEILSTDTETEIEIDLELLLEEVDTRNLVLHNDDVNTFEWVIESIMKICKHSMTQAEQLTMLVHYKGKANVKKGVFSELSPLKDSFVNRGINCTID